MDKHRISNRPISPLYSALSFFILFSFISSFLLDKVYGVEDIDIDVTYPLTPPSELFGETEDWEYIRDQGSTLLPLFHFKAETNPDFDYNTGLTAGFSNSYMCQKLELGRRKLSIYDSTTTDYIKTAFHHKNDSLILQYRNSSWFDLRKEMFSFTSYLVTEGKDYTAEVSTNINHYDNNNEYGFSSNLHRLYNYENMLSFRFSYHHLPYLLDRKKILMINIADRFAYNDYLFIIPGTKGEFISQTLFTPYLHIIYLINKNISLATKLEGNSYETEMQHLFSLPYTLFPNSLNTPINILRGVLQFDVMKDSSFLMKLNLSARKTETSIIAIEKDNYSLYYENLDTTITFTTLLFTLNFSKYILTLHSDFSSVYTPFYETDIPYLPRYRILMDISLHPIKQIFLVNNIKYIKGITDGNGREIEPYYIVSSSCILKMTKNLSLALGILNINNTEERFMSNVHFPGRIIKSGVDISF